MGLTGSSQKEYEQPSHPKHQIPPKLASALCYCNFYLFAYITKPLCNRTVVFEVIPFLGVLRFLNKTEFYY